LKGVNPTSRKKRGGERLGHTRRPRFGGRKRKRTICDPCLPCPWGRGGGLNLVPARTPERKEKKRGKKKDGGINVLRTLLSLIIRVRPNATKEKKKGGELGGKKTA